MLEKAGKHRRAKMFNLILEHLHKYFATHDMERLRYGNSIIYISCMDLSRYLLLIGLLYSLVHRDLPEFGPVGPQ